MKNSRFSWISRCAIAAFAAALLAGCGSDSSSGTHDTPQPSSYQQAFRGVFVESNGYGALDLTLTSSEPWPARTRIFDPSAPAASGTVTGSAIFQGIGTYTVSGTYDSNADTLYFTVNGYAFSGRYYPSSVPPMVSGHIEGTAEGAFHCAFGQDTTVEVYLGHWGKYDTGYTAPMGFVTKGDRLAGEMLLANPQWPFLGYFFRGTISSDTPLRAISATGRGLLDSLVVTGHADASVDTAGGSWTSIPILDTIGSGWWHAGRFWPSPVAIPLSRR